jgi:hypothetical protein
MKIEHRFKDLCVNWDELLARPSVSDFMRAAHSQGLTDAAQRIVQPYKDYDHLDPTSPSPMYFGMCAEVLCEAFLRNFGRNYNLQNIVMGDRNGVMYKDLGVDAWANSVKEERNKANRRPLAGSKIYVQVKGTLNHSKIYSANDGSRLNNFMSNALSSSIAEGQAYQARYVLFTTGKGIHYTLDEATHGFIETISYNDINKLTKNNYDFWNEWRHEVGLAPTVLPPLSEDADSIYNTRLNDRDAA